MMRAASILTLFVALFALLTPTLAAAATSLSTAPSAPVVTATQDGDLCLAEQAQKPVELPHLKPCEKQGGKRLVPCHPDLGVCAMPIELVSATYSHHPVTAFQPVWRQSLPEADTPPPRV